MRRTILFCMSIFLIFSTTTTFSADEKISEYTDTLSQYSIIDKNFTEQEFLEKRTFTRAEAVIFVCRLTGKKDLEAKQIFSDVPENHPSNKYIAYAYDTGIVNGYGDNTFRPDEPVTYSHIIKMLMCAMGYEPAAGPQGYPFGYITKAVASGLTEGIAFDVEDKVTGKNMVRILYNSLDIPLMQQTDFGSYTSYQIMDGTNDIPLVTLKTKLENN